MTLEQLLVKEVQDLYELESEQERRLPRLMQAASSPDLKSTLEDHLTETQAQVQRLAQVLGMVGEAPGGGGQVRPSAQGLIAEAEQVIQMNLDSGFKDLMLIAVAQKVEHDEICCYGTARAIAHTIGQDQAARLLQTTLTEEEQADKRLTQVALVLLKQVGQREPSQV